MEARNKFIRGGEQTTSKEKARKSERGREGESEGRIGRVFGCAWCTCMCATVYKYVSG